MSGIRYTFEDIKKQFEEVFADENTPNLIYKSMDGICRVIQAILTGGTEWTKHVVDENGNPIVIQEQFVEVLRDYIDPIHDFFNKDKMYGGANLPDNLYSKIIEQIRAFDSQIKSQEVFKYESKYDEKDDYSPMPPIGQFATPPGRKPTEVISFRLIVFIVYLILDISRIYVSQSDNIMGRKIMSILVAVLELFRGGDWQKALLSIIGIYSKNMVIFGEILKAFLSLFRFINPTMQDDIIFGLPKLMKSIIAGILLSILQITAPSTVRKAFMELFADITEEKNRIDLQVNKVVSKEQKEKKEEEKKEEKKDCTSEDTPDILPTRSNNFTVTFQDINNFQSVLTDKAYLCSVKIQEIIIELMLKTKPPLVAPNPIISILLSLFGVPKYQEEFEKTCPGQKGTSTLQFPDSIVERTLETRIESVLSETRELPNIKVDVEGQPTTNPYNKVGPGAPGAPAAQVAQVAQVSPFPPFAQPVYLVGQPGITFSDIPVAKPVSVTLESEEVSKAVSQAVSQEHGKNLPPPYINPPPYSSNSTQLLPQQDRG